MSKSIYGTSIISSPYAFWKKGKLTVVKQKVCLTIESKPTKSNNYFRLNLKYQKSFDQANFQSGQIKNIKKGSCFYSMKKDHYKKDWFKCKTVMSKKNKQ